MNVFLVNIRRILFISAVLKLDKENQLKQMRLKTITYSFTKENYLMLQYILVRNKYGKSCLI